MAFLFAFSVEDVRYAMRWIPPGRFLMGSPQGESGRFDREKQHEVVLSRGFWLGATPVTQALWTAVVGEHNSYFQSDDRPVENVSWTDVRERFLPALSQRIPSLAARLPSEAEWERACRAGTTEGTYRGDLKIRGLNDAPLLDSIAWYGGNSGVDFDLPNGMDSSDWEDKQYPHEHAGTHPVGRKQLNPWGLHDMLGNVWEWCGDWYSEYGESLAIDPAGPDSGDLRVLRGGSWLGLARDVRAACRLSMPPGFRDYYVGFRLARGPVWEGGERSEP